MKEGNSVFVFFVYFKGERVRGYACVSAEGWKTDKTGKTGQRFN